ncbi:PerC family transcriptional regulator [Photorhabdus heterorhabditis]|uniref:PerC family transcriptional regulator n=1 Tax=Photorhabdus heterorhabditis TaxID=880156 RepID=UPI001BD3D2F7|nr:PerC family transcriptional regulator [Photorhabdus heterorhabditis]MBS9442246.1 PerC family transcriptional regulator [Photorhabdus heterorhabditis]
MKSFHELKEKAKELEEHGLFRRAANTYSEAIDWALTDEERECCTIDAKRCARKARSPNKAEGM